MFTQAQRDRARGRTRRPIHAPLAAALALMLLASACSGDSSSDDASTGSNGGTGADDELTTIRVGTAAAASLIPIWVAFENGYFLDHGLDVEMESFNTGGEITQAIAAGHLDAGVANLSNAVPIAVSGGTPLRAVVIPDADPSAIFQASRFGVLARGDSGVTAEDPSSLRGKTVGLQVGGTPDIYFANFLASVGLDQSDVSIQSIPVTELGAALEQSIVDVIVTWDPFVLRTMNELDDTVLVQQGGPYASDLSAWVATDEMIDNDTDVARGMLRAIVEAVLFLSENPEAGAEIALKYIDGLTMEEAVFSMDNRYYDPRHSVCTVEELDRAQRDLIEADVLTVDEPLPIETLFATDLLDEVLAEYEDELSALGELPTRAEDCEGY